MIGEPISQKVDKILETITENIGKKKQEIKLPPQIPILNKKLIGLLGGELWILGGYASSGKTFLALQIALEASKQGFMSTYFSLEMSKEALVLRLWASLANVQPLRLMFGQFLPEEFEKIRKAKEKLKDLNLWFSDNLYHLSAIEKEIRQTKPDLVILDYIQNLLPERGEDEYTRLSNGIVRLQGLAKQLSSTIVCCSQVSNIEAKAGAYSKVIGYKGTGGLAAACDVGLWLERELGYGKKKQKVRLYCRKNRRGNLFKTTLVLSFPDGIYEEEINK